MAGEGRLRQLLARGEPPFRRGARGVLTRPELPPGIRIGHWTDGAGRTGTTVILCDAPAIASADARGGAPGTLGLSLLEPSRTVQGVDAAVLTGGSAFGLAAADGVMRWLDERGRGLAIGRARVPIVVGAVIFDLVQGDPRARPTATSGYAACEAATREPDEGSVGAGTGATVAKLGGASGVADGVGIWTERAGDALVTAIMVVNALGGIWDDDRHEWIAPLVPGPDDARAGANTTIGAVVTNARLTKAEAHRVAVAAHDGIARAVRPAHTDFDGDTLFCLSAGGAARVAADSSLVQIAAAEAVARAIARGVRLGAGRRRSPAT